MPTEGRYRLVVEGTPECLALLQGDERFWGIQPWRGMFGLTLDDSAIDRHVYRYDDDYKRPSPSVPEMSVAHPDLTMTFEQCDEFAQRGARSQFIGGSMTEFIELDPLDLDWIEWEEDP